MSSIPTPSAPPTETAISIGRRVRIPGKHAQHAQNNLHSVNGETTIPTAVVGHAERGIKFSAQ